MNWDRFDICEAWYVFAMLWHGGQWTPEYAIFGRLHNMGFKVRPMLSDDKDLTDNGREIYDSLVSALHLKEGTP